VNELFSDVLKRELARKQATEAEMKRRDEEIINQITGIRMRNNVEWMRLLEIALEHAPEETRGVLKRINENDGAISDLLRDLAKW
jgi:hypothetical protein